MTQIFPGFAAAVSFRKGVAVCANIAALPTATTRWHSPTGYWVLADLSSTEDHVAIPITETCTLKNLRLRVNRQVTTASATASVVIRKNGGSEVTLTFADTDVVGTAKTSSTTVALVAGDYITIQTSHDAGSNTSYGYGLTFDLEAATS